MKISLNTNQIDLRNNYIKQNNDDLKNKINTIVSQVSGNVKNVDITYNDDDSIAKAIITVVVSEEEAQKITAGSNKIKVKIIIDKSKSIKQEDSIKNNKLLETKDDDDVFFDEENNDTTKMIYSYRLGPEGKTYVSSSIKKDSSLNNNITAKPFNIYSNANKNIEFYKRYNFKNIHSLEKQDSTKFSLSV